MMPFQMTSTRTMNVTFGVKIYVFAARGKRIKKKEFHKYILFILLWYMVPCICIVMSPHMEFAGI